MAAKTAGPLRVKVERFLFQLIPRSESTNIRSLKKTENSKYWGFCERYCQVIYEKQTREDAE